MQAQFIGKISPHHIHGLITGASQQEIVGYAIVLERCFPNLRPVAHGHAMTTNGIDFSLVFELR